MLKFQNACSSLSVAQFGNLMWTSLGHYWHCLGGPNTWRRRPFGSVWETSKGQCGPPMALSARPKHAALGPHMWCVENPNRPGLGLGSGTVWESWESMVLHFSQAALGWAWIHFELKHTRLGLLWHFIWRLNTPVFIQSGFGKQRKHSSICFILWLCFCLELHDCYYFTI